MNTPRGLILALTISLALTADLVRAEGDCYELRLYTVTSNKMAGVAYKLTPTESPVLK